MKTPITSTEMNIRRTIVVKYLLSTKLLESVTLQNCWRQFDNTFHQSCNNLLTLEIEHFVILLLLLIVILWSVFLSRPGDIGKLIKLNVVCYSHYKPIYSVSGLG